MKSTGCPKTPKQCRERWLHHLCPELIKDKWTVEENKKLLDLQKNNGSKWKEIATHFPFRTDNGIKNQFFSIIRKSLRKACKACGINIGSNVINDVKPKILSDFMNLTLNVKSLIFKSANDEPFRVRDFIRKFAFSKINEIKLSLEQEDRNMIFEAMSRMQGMKFFNQ